MKQVSRSTVTVAMLALSTLAGPFAYAQVLSSDSISKVAAKVTPSVVNVFTSRELPRPDTMARRPFFHDPFFDFFFGPQRRQYNPRMRQAPPTRKQQSLGSGVIISSDGYIITNNHVIKDADEVRVSLNDGREFEAKVVGTDPPSDVAVLKIDVTGLTPIEIGDSSKLRVGDLVLAVGNPFGVGQTVTMGIISAIGRANTGLVDYEDFIQTDAAINPGNSGGALVNMEGKLIGINTAIASRSGGYQGIGFAIPSNMAMTIKDNLLEYGRVIRGWLGVSIQNVTPEIAEVLGLTPGKGVLVADVTKGSPADKAGLEREDVILSVDGVKTNDMARLRTIIATKGAGHKVTLELNRKGTTFKKDVVLGELPEELMAGAPKAVTEPGIDALAGLKVSTVNPMLRRKYDLPDDVQGVVVTGVEPGTRAAYSGLREGDVILRVNRTEVKNVKELRKALKKAGKAVVLLVYRDGYTLFLALRHR